MAGPAAPGNWDDIKTTYPGLVKFGVIGCESCHGAGSNHPASGQPGSQFLTSATYRAGACAQCHDEPWRHNIYAQCMKTLFTQISVLEITTGSNANTNNLNDCGRCHDGRVYIQFTKGYTASTPGIIDVKTLTEANCYTCNLSDLPRSTWKYKCCFFKTILLHRSDTLGNGYAYTSWRCWQNLYELP